MKHNTLCAVLKQSTLLYSILSDIFNECTYRECTFPSQVTCILYKVVFYLNCHSGILL